jgi:hypothetical protein
LLLSRLEPGLWQQSLAQTFSAPLKFYRWNCGAILRCKEIESSLRTFDIAAKDAFILDAR